ncbi:hypothetical protein [Streptomyces atratus]|uniref:hypothetical protein n=1 Tax=Streptomyces atratus TaxID=1893 RepID=UPI00378B432E
MIGRLRPEFVQILRQDAAERLVPLRGRLLRRRTEAAPQRHAREQQGERADRP